MKIAFVSSRLLHGGGEDVTLQRDIEMLREHGHQVELHLRSSVSLKDLTRLQLAGRNLWSLEEFSVIRRWLHRIQPDVVHVHNFFPTISPAVFHAARAEHLPVVFTLHNYRLICPAIFFLRNGQPCRKCSGKAFAWPGVIHGCYRGSRMATSAVATMLIFHRLLGTWHTVIGRYIAITAFMRDQMVEAGFPAEKIALKYNYLHPDPGFYPDKKDYVLYSGRLSDEKGLFSLLDAWQKLPKNFQLKIAGRGPLEAAIRHRIRHMPNVELLGFLSGEEYIRTVGQAVCLIVPSLWYEGCPQVIMEAYGTGTPVLASDHGSLVELVEQGVTGLRFQPGSADAIAGTVKKFMADPETRNSMSEGARQAYIDKFSEDKSYRELMRIYEGLLARPA